MIITNVHKESHSPISHPLLCCVTLYCMAGMKNNELGLTKLCTNNHCGRCSWRFVLKFTIMILHFGPNYQDNLQHTVQYLPHIAENKTIMSITFIILTRFCVCYDSINRQEIKDKYSKVKPRIHNMFCYFVRTAHIWLGLLPHLLESELKSRAPVTESDPVNGTESLLRALMKQ